MRIGGRKYAAEVARRKAQRASNLRRLRDGRAWTQPELGRRLGMPASYVCQMETGSRPITLQTVDRVAAALELPPAQVLAELDAPSAVPEAT